MYFHYNFFACKFACKCFSLYCLFIFHFNVFFLCNLIICFFFYLSFKNRTKFMQEWFIFFFFSFNCSIYCFHASHSPKNFNFLFFYGKFRYCAIFCGPSIVFFFVIYYFILFKDFFQIFIFIFLCSIYLLIFIYSISMWIYPLNVVKYLFNRVSCLVKESLLYFSPVNKKLHYKLMKDWNLILNWRRLYSLPLPSKRVHCVYTRYTCL